MWDTHAETWTQSVQYITLAPCQELIQRTISSSPTSSIDYRFLDDGCGAGAVTSLLKSRFPSVDVTATDVSTGMLDSARQRARTENWNATFLQMNAEDLSGLDSNSFSHGFSTFVISFTDQPSKAMKEMQRVLRPGGTAGIANWSRISWVPIWQEAARAVKGDDYIAPTLFHPDTMEVDTIERDLVAAGFQKVDVKTFECYHPEKTVDTAVDQFYNMGNPSTKLLMKDFSKEEIEQSKPHFKAAYERMYDGGKKRQFELALLATGRKPTQADS